ncbi:energy transducer TonB [Sphingomonas sp. AOB5]|uniref:energy transducer TonB n=1 Tax=Sphingomonas sp. AOB5 TaxID=3034017 RepID=UPI0023F662D4|nr:energy transducer TonB [Sphingomonas sp. AOB5]MDF7774648.1 energy transducer TonB [Sphingomonas sp. AOB5]
MTCLRFILAVTCCVAALPAAAQEIEWSRYGSPDLPIVYRDATGCLQKYTSSLEPGVDTVIREDVTGLVTMSAYAGKWQFPENASHEVRLIPSFYSASEGLVMPAQARSLRDARGRSGLSVSLPYAQLRDAYRGANIALHLGADEKPLVTFDAPASGSLRHRCAVELSRVDPGSGKPVATKAIADMDRPVVTNDDYPPAALRAEQQGITTMSFTISAKGLISNCAIIGTSGSALLDNTACSILSARARFKPALDADGNPTEETRTLRFEWRLPGNRPPPPPTKAPDPVG